MSIPTKRCRRQKHKAQKQPQPTKPPRAQTAPPHLTKKKRATRKQLHEGDAQMVEAPRECWKRSARRVEEEKRERRFFQEASSASQPNEEAQVQLAWLGPFQ